MRMQFRSQREIASIRCRRSPSINQHLSFACPSSSSSHIEEAYEKDLDAAVEAVVEAATDRCHIQASDGELVGIQLIIIVNRSRLVSWHRRAA